MTRSLRRTTFAGLISASLAVGCAASARAETAAALDAQIDAALHAAYDLDRAAGLSAARRAVALAPDESRAHRALATLLWLDALFQRGAVTVDTYLGGVTSSRLSLPRPPEAVDAEFRQEIQKAIDLADARHRAQPGDLGALEDLGAAYGIEASYTASVDGHVMGAIGIARRAFDLEEDVLARDPGDPNAAIIVGSYRYAVSKLGVASRMLAYLAGFGGGTERGIALLEAASRRTDAPVEARTALVLIYSREGRHRDALRVLAGLAADFPHNRVFVLEQAAAAIRAGRPAEADTLLTRGLAALDHDPRPRMPGERALWLYKRGFARLKLDHMEAASTDLRAALDAGPLPWIRGRITLALGEVADARGRRADAVTHYRDARRLADSIDDPLCSARAVQLLRSPFVLRGGTS